MGLGVHAVSSSEPSILSLPSVLNPKSGTLGSGVAGLLQLEALRGDEALGGRAGGLLEDAVEVREVAEAGLEGRVDDVAGFEHDALGVLDANLGEVLRDGLAGAALELLGVAAVGEVGEHGQLFDLDRAVEILVDEVDAPGEG